MVQFEKPVYRDLGDLYIAVDYGDTAEISLSFRVNALNLFIKKRKLKGILETISTVHSLAIVHDPFIISKHELVEELKKIEVEENLKEMTELPSRLIRIPVWFDDPWSDECAKAHGLENNLRMIAKLNGMSVEEIIRIYNGNQYWIAGTAFLLGTFNGFPLRSSKITLNVPKYPVPRTWTYEREFGVAGDMISIYSIRSPGGYQLIGRTPINIYEPEQRNHIFKQDPIIVKATDRIECYPISEAEYYRIRREVEEGTYHYEIKEEVYSLINYKVESY